jgi:hypothetical protein
VHDGGGGDDDDDTCYPSHYNCSSVLTDMVVTCKVSYLNTNG